MKHHLLVKASHKDFTLCVLFLSLMVLFQYLVFFAQGKDLYAGSSIKTFSREINKTDERYEIYVGGAIDGENSRLPSAYSQSPPIYEPNITLALENIGDKPIKNPRVKLRGKGTWFTMDELLADIISPLMTEAEKARAIYEFHIHHRAHACEGIAGKYLNPLRFYQNFGFSICFDDSAILSAMWKAAGLKVRLARPYNHSISEVFYDNDWHLFDGDLNAFYLDYDNSKIVSDIELARDHYLVKRTHNYGLLTHDYFSPKRNPIMHDEKAAGLYSVTTPNISDSRPTPEITNLDYTLRPDEKLVFFWQNKGEFCFYSPERYYVKLLYNGQLVYAPKNWGSFLKYGCIQVENLSVTSDYLQSQTCGIYSKIIIPMGSPYPIVGGSLGLKVNNLEKGDFLRIYLKPQVGGRRYIIKEIQNTEGDSELNLMLDKVMAQAMKQDKDKFFIRIEWVDKSPGKRLQISNLKITADIQMAPLGMPALRAGKNFVQFKSDTTGKIRITHQWRESFATRPPEPPLKPISPPDGVTTNSLRFTFRWEPAKDPDGDKITDYHFILSDRRDCRWALSPNFEKLISRTQNAGKAEYTIPYEGLLNPGQTYYWKVRACDECGIWSQWSKIWKFTPQGPARPIEPGYTVMDNRIKIHWKPATQGTPPQYYEIFASNESGFTPDPQPHSVLGLSPLPFQEIFLERRRIDINDVHGEVVKVPGNLVTTTKETEIFVVGEDLSFEAGFNRCYYRIQGVDERGAKSGYTAQIELPHPFIYSRPPARIKLNQPFTYQLKSLYSLGSVLGGKPEYTYSLRQQEKVTFHLEGAPEGISIDKTTGLISGLITHMPAEDFITFNAVATASKNSAKQTVRIKVEP